MHCWVKVVDQNGHGIKGYKCRVVEEHSSWSPFSSNGDIVRVYITGGDGSFEYKSRGTTGRVFFGYPFDMEWTLNPLHLLEQKNLAVYAFRLKEARENNPSDFLGSARNPYILHVFSVGRPQKLLYWYKRTHIAKEDDYACLDILGGTISERKTPQGDIAIRDISSHSECEMRFIAGNDCALYPVIDDWGLEAPESQYMKSLCWAKDWMGKKRQAYNRIQVYFRLSKRVGGKTLYGKIDFGASSRIDDATIQCFTNLQGKRSLYYDGYIDSMRTYKFGQIKDYVSPPVAQEDLKR